MFFTSARVLMAHITANRTFDIYAKRKYMCFATRSTTFSTSNAHTYTQRVFDSYINISNTVVQNNQFIRIIRRPIAHRKKNARSKCQHQHSPKWNPLNIIVATMFALFWLFHNFGFLFYIRSRGLLFSSIVVMTDDLFTGVQYINFRF